MLEQEELMEIKNKLTEGLEVKTYKNLKEVCEIMGWKYYKGGCSKKKQLEDLERYCIYHREGNKFVVDYVFPEPMPEKMTHIVRSTIQMTILYMLSYNRVVVDEGDIWKVNISKGKLMLITGLVNSSFNHYMYNQEQFISLMKKITCTEIEEDLVAEYFNRALNNVNGYINRAIKDLEDKALVHCTKDVFNVFKDGRSYPATDEEVEIILKCKREVMDELGYESEKNIKWGEKLQEYKKLVLERLEEKGSPIKNFYKVYTFVGNKNYIPNEYYSLKSQLQDMYLETNSEMGKIILNSFNNKKKRIIDSGCEDLGFYGDEHFEEYIRLFVEKTIDNSEEDCEYIFKMLL